MADVTIRPSKNGPFTIEGPVELFNTDGDKIIVDKPHIALCRCDASSHKLFCEGRIARLVFSSTVNLPSKRGIIRFRS